MFFIKLALQNLHKNKRAYLPFLISMLFLIALNTVTQLVITNPDMADIPGGASAQSMFGFGGGIIMVFSVIFAIYTNSFLLKQRQKEFGLYNVLGMGKRELYHLVFWENVFSFIGSLIAGLLTGFVFGKLSFLILKKILGTTATFGFHVSWANLATVTILFLGIYAFLLLVDFWRIHRTNPIDLLHADRSGEKEPKSKWILTLIGLICLGTGYYWAVTIKTPLDAINLFFIAVILVIGGTYCLFIAGSVTLLKFLKNRPKFYYKANHFISVSNMIYRMKQNAAGLASICILSTMVLVTMASTVSLYIGQADTIESQNPYDIQTSSDPEQLTTIETAVAKTQAKYPNVKLKHQVQADTFNSTYSNENNNFKPLLGSTGRNTIYASFLTAATYERITGDKANLETNKVIAYPVSGDAPARHFKIMGEAFTIQKVINSLPNFKQVQSPIDTYVFVVKDQQTIKQLAKISHPGEPELQKMTSVLAFDLGNASDKTKTNFSNSLRQQLPQEIAFSAKSEAKANSNVIIGGFLFLGLIFGLAFTLATALIIYYKQISEGMDDKKRFDILQKVGLDHRAVKKAIHSQILTVFFFPIIVAVIHLGFAFSFIKKLLLLFGLYNESLILWTTLAAVLGFAIIYFIVYQLTAKAYYRIVERG